MTPDRRYPICQLCGARHGSDDSPCPGPRVDHLGDFAYEITKRLDEVRLPGEATDG